MNFSDFFIKRPIFAGVLSIAIFVMGLIAMFKLPIGEYPEVVPPTIVVKANYPGANPKTHCRDGGLAARTSHQRRRRFALHVLAGDR
ncbi:MAG: efflux RND transporter permease subunit [Limisphaerales bacterium]